MSTNYNLSDRAPKDIDGAKFWSIINVNTSQLDFALPIGLAARNFYSKNFAYLGVGTHTQASAVGNGDIGLMLAGLYTDDSAASPVSSGQAQLLKSSRKGELLVNGASKLAIMNATSANIYTLGSGILHGGYITGAGVTAGDSVSIRSNTNTVINLTFGAANETIPLNIPAGGIYFGASITHSQSISGGAASVTLFVERP